MQPVFPHYAQSYPPRGAIWPQFGDDVLEDTLSVSEGARQSLNRKREAMSDFHKENLQHHGLAAREPPAREWFEDSDNDYAPGPGDPPPQRMDATDAVDPPRRPLSVQRGVVARYDPPGTMEQGAQASAASTDQATQASVMEPMQVEPKKKTLSYQRAFMTDAPSGRGEMGTQTSVPEEMDQEDIPTQYYGSDIEVDDQEMQRRVDKRPKPIKTERKVKIKVDPVKLEPVKAEVKVKKEPGVSAPLAAPQSSASSVLAPQQPDDEVLTTSVNFNNNTDMSFWEAASGNEIKSQLNLRFPHRSGDWQFKDRAQLISFVRGLIKRGQWVQGEAPGPVRSSAAQRSAPYPWPAASAAPAVDPDDDDIQVGEVSWDTNQDPAYWAEQSSNYIRAQLTRRYPTQRHRFAFMKERQEYIDFITNLIKRGKW